MRRVTVQLMACVVVLPLLQSCITAQQITGAAFLPLAAIGDTVVAPFQACGNASASLIAAGNERSRKCDADRDSNRSSSSAVPRLPARDGVMAWVYYVPGYALLPCDVVTPSRYYALTKDCLRDMRSPSARVTETSPSDEPPPPQIRPAQAGQ